MSLPLPLQLTFDVDVEGVIEAARAAGAVIMDVYRQEEGWEVEQKADNSPLTRADREANAVICGEAARAALLGDRGSLKALRRSPRPPRASRAHRFRGEHGGAVRGAAELPLLLVCGPAGRHKGASQCAIDARSAKDSEYMQEFIKRNGQFTVNIALLRGGTPVLGVVHTPVTVRAASLLSHRACSTPPPEPHALVGGGPRGLCARGRRGRRAHPGRLFPRERLGADAGRLRLAQYGGD